MNPITLKGLLHLLETEPRENRKLLDASCGSGATSKIYRDLGWQVTPTSYDPSTFEVPDMTCLRQDLNEPWAFPDEEFDVVVLQGVIEHLESMPFIFREIKRVLKPNGVFVFSTANM